MRPRESGSVVVTGSSGGIGRAVAVAFGRLGWRVGLIARSEQGLESARQEVEAAGGRSLAVTADVADANAVFAAADRFAAAWDGIDVWVNNAMATIFAPVRSISPEEFRRVTEVTYLGQVHGTMAALAHMLPRDSGTIVQVGSALSYRSIPLQSAYCGAKFAIRGFTDSLRSELAHDGSRIRLTMVQLPAVNTPQFDWARSRLPRRPQPVPPIHQPEPIAEEIVRAAFNAPREAWVGGASVKAIMGNMLVPGLLDRKLASAAYQGQMTSAPADQDHRDNLFEPMRPEDYRMHGRFDSRAHAEVSSVASSALRSGLAFAALGLAAGLFFAGARWREAAR